MNIMSCKSLQRSGLIPGLKLLKRTVTKIATEAPEMPPCDFVPKPYKGSEYDNTVKVKEKHVVPSLQPYYKKPLLIHQGHMQWLFDHTGKRYLDMFGGIVTVSAGHCHPKVNEAVFEQMKTLWHTTNIYLHPKLYEYVEKLVTKLPGDLKVVYLVNSGSEANDLAMLLARVYTQNYDIISFRNGYHGTSPYCLGLTALSSWKYNIPTTMGIHHGVGGTLQFPRGFLKKAYELIRSNGGICIADEVQTGFGRTGDTFWGFESHKVIPDIVTVAKGIGNGYPLAAVITTPKVAEALGKANHFNTFGGNPVACTAGIATLEVIEEERLQENCKKVGTHLLNELAKLRDEFEIVGDVRGKGLMIGVEMVTNKSTKEPLSAKRFADIWENCKDMGVLIGRGGLNGHVLRIKPPMCITMKDADFTVAVLRKALQMNTKKCSPA